MRVAAGLLCGLVLTAVLVTPLAGQAPPSSQPAWPYGMPTSQPVDAVYGVGGAASRPTEAVAASQPAIRPAAFVLSADPGGLPPGAARQFGGAAFQAPSAIDAVAFSPDGKQVAAATAYGVTLFDVPSGRPRATLPVPSRPPAVQFSPDGRAIAVLCAQTYSDGGVTTLGHDGAVRVFDTATGRELPRPAVNTLAKAVCFTNDSRSLLVVHQHSLDLVMVDLASGQPTARIPIGTGNMNDYLGVPIMLRVGPGDRTVAVGFFNDATGGLTTIDLVGKKQLARARIPGALLDLAFSPGGKLQVLYGGLNAAKLHTVDVASPAPLNFPPVEASGTTYFVRNRLAGALSPDGKRFVHSSRALTPGVDVRDTTPRLDCTLFLKDVAGGKSVQLGQTMMPIHAIAFSPDGKRLATAGSEGMIYLWDADTGQRTGEESPISGSLQAVAVRADGKFVAVAGAQGVIHIFDVVAGKVARSLTGNAGNVTALAWTDDGKTIATVDRGGVVRFHDLANPDAVESLKLGSGFYTPTLLRAAAAFSADGRTLFIADGRGVIVIDTVARRVLAINPIDRRNRQMQINRPPQKNDTNDADTAPDMKDVATRLAFVREPNWQDQYGAMARMVGIEQMLGIDAPQANPNAMRQDPWGLQAQGFNWTAAAVSPDRRLVAVAADDILKLVDAATLQDVRRLAPRGEPQKGVPYRAFHFLAFTPDGTKVVAVQDSQTAGQWQPYTNSHQPIGRGRQLIRVFDTATGSEVSQFGGAAGHAGPINAIGMDRAGQVLYTAGHDGRLIGWDLSATIAPAGGAPANAEAASLFNAALEDDSDAAADATRLLASRPADVLAQARAYLALPPDAENNDIAALVQRFADPSLRVRVQSAEALAARRNDPAVELQLLRTAMSFEQAGGVSADVWRRVRAQLGAIGVETDHSRRLRRLCRLLEWTLSPDAQTELNRIASTLSPIYAAPAQQALSRVKSGQTQQFLRTLPPLPGVGPTAATRPVATRPVVKESTLPTVPTLPATLPSIAPAPALADVVDASPLPEGALARLGGGGAFRHGGTISLLSYSRDGRVLATASTNQTVRVWESPGGRELALFPGGSEELGCAVSPDGKSVAVIGPIQRFKNTNSPYNLVTVYDIATRKPLFTSPQKPDDQSESVYQSVVFSPDGKLLVAGMRSTIGKVWDTSNWAAAADLDPMSGNKNPAVRKFTRDISVGGGQGMQSLQFNTTGDRLLIGHGMHYGRTIISASVWDFKTRKLLGCSLRLNGANTPKFELGAGNTLYAQLPREYFGPEDNKPLFPDTEGVQVISAATKFKLDGLNLRLAAVSPDGRLAAVENPDTPTEPNNLRVNNDQVRLPTYLTLYDTSTGNAVRRLGPFANPTPENLSQNLRSVSGSSTAQFSPDGRHIAVTGTSGVVSVFDTSTGQLLSPVPPVGNTAIAVSPDGRSILTGGGDGSLLIRPAPTVPNAAGKVLARLKGTGAPIIAVGFSPDGTRVAAIDINRTLRVASAADLKVTSTIRTSLELGTDEVATPKLAFSADGQQVAITHGNTELYNLPTGQKDVTFGAAARQFWPLSDGSIAVYSNGMRMLNRSLMMEQERTEPITAWPMVAVAVSPDRRWIASKFDKNDLLEQGGCVLIGDARSGMRLNVLLPKDLARFGDGEHRSLRVFFSPNSRLVAAVVDAQGKAPGGKPLPPADPTAPRQVIHLWRLDTGEAVATWAAHSDTVREVAFSPGSDVLYSASQDGSVLAWKVPALLPPKPNPAAMPANDDARLSLLVPEQFNARGEETLRTLRSAWDGLQAMATDSTALAATFDKYYRLGDEKELEVVELINQLGNPATAEPAIAKLADLQSSRSLAERAMFRALLDLKTPPAVRAKAREVVEKRMNCRVETTRVVRFIVAFRQANTPAARQALQRMADNLPPRCGGNVARDALGLPPVKE
jgi:WD40 repeat protein